MCTVKQMPAGAKDVESIGIGFTYGYEPHYLGLGKETGYSARVVCILNCLPFLQFQKSLR